MIIDCFRQATHWRCPHAHTDTACYHSRIVHYIDRYFTFFLAFGLSCLLLYTHRHRSAYLCRSARDTLQLPLTRNTQIAHILRRFIKVKGFGDCANNSDSLQPNDGVRYCSEVGHCSALDIIPLREQSMINVKCVHFASTSALNS